jgi:methylphosphotriester-DNA--protein-cysteine methyltransferase
MSISSTLFQRAEIQFHEAADSLRAFVGCFWVVTADRNATIRVVPDSSTAISIQLVEGEPTGWTLRGPLIRPDERRFKSPATMIGVRLRPGVAFILSGIAAQATVGRRIRLSEIPALHELVSAEADLRTPEQCIKALQGFLVQRLKDARVQDVVATAMREIERAHGCVRVAEVAARCRVSPRHLNRLMRIWVGYGPKCFASIVRFQESLKQIDHSPSQPAAVLASETGFFDQSHMSLNLTKFAGATPGHLTSKCVADFSKTRCDDLP